MKGTILIADDEPLARRTLREHLRDLGCGGEIHEAPDGETAIAVANKERPGLMFLDIVMPGATGLEVLERLDYEPKVIFTTAHDQYAVTAFELGALDYLLKPFGRDRLERVLQRAQAARPRSFGVYGRQPGGYPETGFEAISARTPGSRSTFPPTGLLGSQADFTCLIAR